MKKDNDINIGKIEIEGINVWNLVLDELVKSLNFTFYVIPAKAGIQ